MVRDSEVARRVVAREGIVRQLLASLLALTKCVERSCGISHVVLWL